MSYQAIPMRLVACLDSSRDVGLNRIHASGKPRIITMRILGLNIVRQHAAELLIIRSLTIMINLSFDRTHVRRLKLLAKLLRRKP